MVKKIAQGGFCLGIRYHDLCIAAQGICLCAAVVDQQLNYFLLLMKGPNGSSFNGGTLHGTVVAIHNVLYIVLRHHSVYFKQYLILWSGGETNECDSGLVVERW